LSLFDIHRASYTLYAYAPVGTLGQIVGVEQVLGELEGTMYTCTKRITGDSLPKT